SRRAAAPGRRGTGAGRPRPCRRASSLRTDPARYRRSRLSSCHGADPRAGILLSRSTEEVARAYFEALALRDWDAVGSAWAEDAAVRVVGRRKLRVPDQWRSFVEAVWSALPDLSVALVEVSADGEMAAARWRLNGTFCGEAFEGVEPTGATVAIDVCELIRVRDGLIDRSSVGLGCSWRAAQLGIAPWMIAAEPERIADGVWVLRGGYPMRSMNVFLLEDDGGVVLFDAGIRAMVEPIRAAAGPLGGVK